MEQLVARRVPWPEGRKFKSCSRIQFPVSGTGWLEFKVLIADTRNAEHLLTMCPNCIKSAQWSIFEAIDRKCQKAKQAKACVAKSKPKARLWSN